jgi:HEAT repeat protein
LRDVEASDIYIGIIGRRYGWVPPESALSITEPEYRQAVRTEKEILIFLLDDSAPGWPEADEAPDRQVTLKRFREHLSTAHLPAIFSSCKELAIKVVVSLVNLGSTATTLCDPQSEEQTFKLLQSGDAATRVRARRRLVDMGSAAYAFLLRQDLRNGHGTPEQRTNDVRDLADIENRNQRVMPILRDLLRAEDPTTMAAVVFEFAQRGLQGKRVTDEDVRAIIKLFTHEDRVVRREAAHSMWKFLPRSEPMLLEMRVALAELGSSDPNEDVQRCAGYSARRIDRY